MRSGCETVLCMDVETEARTGNPPPPRDGLDLDALRPGHLAAASGALLALVVLGYLYLTEVGPFPGEARLAEAMRSGLPQGANLAANLMSYLGDPLIAGVLLVLLIAGAWEERGRTTAALVAGAAGVLLLSKLLKALFGPTQLVAPGINDNYPSGTTAFVTSVLGLTAWLAWRGGHRTAAAGCALLVVAVGPGVIAIGEHYPSDVLAGYATGGAWLLAVLAVAARFLCGTAKRSAVRLAGRPEPPRGR